MANDLSPFLGYLDSSAPSGRGRLSCFRGRKIKFLTLACMCVEGSVDELLMVTKACLLVLNVKEAREGAFLHARVQEPHLLGQGVTLDEHADPSLEYLFILLVREALFSLFHSKVYD